MNNYNYRNNSQNAFSASETLLIFLIVAALGIIIFFIVNPSKNYAESRNTERQVEVTEIAGAINLYVEENGSLGKLDEKIPTCPQTANISKQEINLEEVLVSKYIPQIPKDPKTGSEDDTGYDICKNINGRYTISAPDAENDAEIYFRK